MRINESLFEKAMRRFNRHMFNLRDKPRRKTVIEHNREEKMIAERGLPPLERILLSIFQKLNTITRGSSFNRLLLLYIGLTLFDYN